MEVSTSAGVTAAAISEEAQEHVSALSIWLSQAGNTVISFLIRAIIAILIYLIIRKITDKLVATMEKYMAKHQVEPTVQHFVSALLRYGILGFTVITIIVNLHIVEASSIAALIAAGSVGISLAMQGALSNFAGGILLLILKPFREGDYIIVKDSGVEGTVTKIELYYTTIQTLLGTTTMVPNSELTNHSVQNMASERRKGLLVKVGISYNADIAKAKAVLEDIKANEPRLYPGIGQVSVDELGESAVILAIRGLVDAADYYQTLWSLNETIRIRFAKENIEIPYNQLVVHLINPKQEN